MAFGIGFNPLNPQNPLGGGIGSSSPDVFGDLKDIISGNNNEVTAGAVSNQVNQGRLPSYANDVADVLFPTSGVSGDNSGSGVGSSSATGDMELDWLREMMSFNSAEAVKNREFQKMMSDTSYQRAVQDLREAGLNPVLAISGLSGASSPSGSAASVSGSYGYAGKQVNASQVNSTSNLIYTVGNLLVSVARLFSGSMHINSSGEVSRTFRGFYR